MNNSIAAQTVWAALYKYNAAVKPDAKTWTLIQSAMELLEGRSEHEDDGPDMAKLKAAGIPEKLSDLHLIKFASIDWWMKRFPGENDTIDKVAVMNWLLQEQFGDAKGRLKAVQEVIDRQVSTIDHQAATIEQLREASQKAIDLINIAENAEAQGLELLSIQQFGRALREPGKVAIVELVAVAKDKAFPEKFAEKKHMEAAATVATAEALNKITEEIIAKRSFLERAMDINGLPKTHNTYGLINNLMDEMRKNIKDRNPMDFTQEERRIYKELDSARTELSYTLIAFGENTNNFIYIRLPLKSNNTPEIALIEKIRALNNHPLNGDLLRKADDILKEIDGTNPLTEEMARLKNYITPKIIDWRAVVNSGCSTEIFTANVDL